MNVYGIRPGNRALVVGAGNVGLIVAYQLLQADIEVIALVEMMPKLGGYLVHASKLVRHGVPILLRHTIREITGDEYVRRATIMEVDENGKPVEGTEQELDVDLILTAVGLSGSSEILLQAGCEQNYIEELKGWIPIHNINMETTIEGIYLAGDSGGIAEASTAMLEGTVAAASIAEKTGLKQEEAKKIKIEAISELNRLRESTSLITGAAGKRRCDQKMERE